MNMQQWTQIIAEIEKNLERAGYTLNGRLANGNAIQIMSWQLLGKDVIVFSKDDSPPIYVPVQNIQWITLST